MSLASDTWKFIMVRVPRTGSTTLSTKIQVALGPHVVDRGGAHPTAVELREIWKEKWGAYTTFGFIRNPWEWMVSVYNSGISRGAGVKDLWAGNPIEPRDTPGIHPGQRSNMAFPDWVRQRKTSPVDWLRDGTEIIVDHVFRFEDLIQLTPYRASAVPHRHYSEWYTPDLVDYVAQRCRREVEIGGYNFDPTP